MVIESHFTKRIQNRTFPFGVHREMARVALGCGFTKPPILSSGSPVVEAFLQNLQPSVPLRWLRSTSHISFKHSRYASSQLDRVIIIIVTEQSGRNHDRTNSLILRAPTKTESARERFHFASCVSKIGLLYKRSRLRWWWIVLEGCGLGWKTVK